MRRLSEIICAVFTICVMAVAVSCEKRPLLEMSNTHYVRVYVNESIQNVTTGFYNEGYTRPEYKSPDVLRVFLADPQTGRVKAERFLRNNDRDENGLYYDGYIIADPGEYTLLAYNFDTETTVIVNQDNHNEILASTNEIAAHLKTKIPSRSKAPSKDDAKGEPMESIVYDPDHLFAANCGYVRVPYVEYVDTLRTQDGDYFRAETVVKSYFLQVRVKGLQYATSSVGLLNGLSGSVYLRTGDINLEHPATVYFEMLPGESAAAGVSRAGADDGEAIIYTTFGTFGKLPDMENELEITFDFLTVYGQPHSETINITDVFSKQEAIENQWLLLDHVISIPEPPPGTGSEGGGFKPSVDGWSDVNTDINL